MVTSEFLIGPQGGPASHRSSGGFACIGVGLREANDIRTAHYRDQRKEMNPGRVNYYVSFSPISAAEFVLSPKSMNEP